MMTNPLLLIIAVFVWMAAGAEAGLARVRQTLRGKTVETAMRTEFAVLGPDDTLGRAAELSIRHGQADFPVLVAGRLAGLLPRHALTRSLSADGADRTAGEVMQRTFETVDRFEPLEGVFARVSQAPDRMLPVTDHGRLVGLIGLDEITTLQRLEPPGAGRADRATPPEPSPALHTSAPR
jgi:CBS domain-containing protein